MSEGFMGDLGDPWALEDSGKSVGVGEGCRAGGSDLWRLGHLWASVRLCECL